MSLSLLFSKIGLILLDHLGLVFPFVFIVRSEMESKLSCTDTVSGALQISSLHLRSYHNGNSVSRGEKCSYSWEAELDFDLLKACDKS